MFEHLIDSIVDLLNSHSHVADHVLSDPHLHQQIGDPAHHVLNGTEIRFGVENPDPDSKIDLVSGKSISGHDAVVSGDGTLYADRYEYSHSSNPIDPKDIKSVTPPPSDNSSSRT
jgi:hypothetical protein